LILQVSLRLPEKGLGVRVDKLIVARWHTVNKEEETMEDAKMPLLISLALLLLDARRQWEVTSSIQVLLAPKQ
jgi:hypothetical protein